MKRFLYFVILLLVIQIFVAQTTLLTGKAANQSGGSEYSVIRFSEPDQKLLDFVEQQDYEIIRFSAGDYLEILVQDHQLADIEREGWHTELLFTESDMRNNLRLKTDELEGYRSYNDVLDELTGIANDYPEIAALYDIGDSRGKEYAIAGNQNYTAYAHDIWALKVTANPNQESDRPAVYYNGAHHAREPISVEVVMHILWHLIDNYSINPGITYLVDNTEIWFIPLLNPDGHKIVFDETNTSWRKNIRDNYNTGTISAGDGVDLNRNYSYEWQLTGTPITSTYGGPYASSEPETTALRDLWQERNFVAGISYHSYGQLVLFPPGYVSGLTSPDVQAQYALALEMAQSIPVINGTGNYTAQHSWQLYPATGTCEDDAYCTQGIFAHTLELATVFIPPVSQIAQICEDNLEAALILLERVHHSTLTGTISDHTTSEPLVAEVHIPGIDDTGVYRAPYESSEEYGRYYRLLLPGDYNVQFFVPGYFKPPQVSFTIDDSTQTIVNQELVRLTVPNIISYFGGDQFVRLSWVIPVREYTVYDSQVETPPYRLSEAEGFNVYRNGILINPESLVNENIFYDFEVDNGVDYTYQVTTVYPEGESNPSETVSVTPLSGTIISPETITVLQEGGTLALQWEPVENALGYRIYSTSDPMSDDWIFLEYIIDTVWFCEFSEPMKFFRISAVY